jgi:hypothetical protein
VYNAPDQINTSGSWTNALPIVTATDTLGAGVTATFDAFAGHTYHIAVDGVAKGIFFISSDTGAYSVAVSTSGTLGTVYATDVDSGARETHISGDQAVQYYNQGNQIGGLNSLVFSGNLAIGGKASWTFDAPLGLEAGITEFSFRFRHRSGFSTNDAWALGFYLFPYSIDPSLILQNLQYTALVFDSRATESVYVSSQGGTSSPISFGVSTNQIHSLKCSINAAGRTATFTLDSRSPYSIPIDLPSSKGIGFGPTFLFLGNPTSQTATLAIDDLKIQTTPRKLGSQLRSSLRSNVLQLTAIGEPGEALALEGSNDLQLWNSELQITVGTNGFSFFPNLVPSQAQRFYRLHTP